MPPMGDLQSWPAVVLMALAALLGVSIAVNGFFLKTAFHELRELRDRDRDREVQVGRLDERVGSLERGRGPLSPAPVGGRRARA